MNSVINNNKDFSKKKLLLTAIMFIFPFFHYYGFFYQGFNIQIIKGLYFFMLFGMAVYFGRNWFSKSSHIPYYGLMKYIMISTVLTMLMAYIFWGQDLFSSYIATAGLNGIIYYFFLIKIRPSLKQVETVIIFYAILFLIAWLYGYYKAPLIVFGDPDAPIDDSRGMIRLRIPGIEAVVLFLFMMVNRFIREKKVSYIIYSLVALVLIALQLTRQVLFWSSIIAVVYLFFNVKKTIILLVLTVIVAIFMTRDIKFAEGSVAWSLLNLTEQQLQKQKVGEDDTRVRALDFFFTSFSKNIVTDLFGNGVPYPKSEYGNYYVKNINEQKSIYMSDVGYAHMFAVYGLTGLCLFLVLFFRGVRDSIPSELMYVKLYFIYLIFVTIASIPYTNMAILGLVVYLLSRYKNDFNLDGRIIKVDSH